jgi:ABC-2 type transport system ATP-binding protein
MNAIDVTDLGKRYRRRWALRHCTLSVPAGRIVGLVGSNGAGKSTLLHLLVGLTNATEGSARVLGDNATTALDRIGFVAQDAPVYPTLTVGEHLRLGAHLNPAWNGETASARVAQLGLDLSQRAGRLSGGQRAQLALTLAIGKEPEVLLLDEPVASLDPLARRQFMEDLMVLAAERQPTIVLSSHLLSDVERICDYLIVLRDGAVQLSGDVDDLLATHKLVVGRRRAGTATLPANDGVVFTSHTDRQTTAIIRSSMPIMAPGWEVHDVGLEELVLGYMRPDNRDTRAVSAVAS